MKNLVIFGGTGMTGEEAVLYAVSKGFHVRILVRDNSTIPASIKDKVEVINGDVLNYEDVEKALKDQDAVVVVLGTRDKLDPTTAMSEGLQNIVSGMKELGLKKVSVCLSAFLFYEKVPKTMQDITFDHVRMFEILKTCHDLEWRALLPPRITNGPAGSFQVRHDEGIVGENCVTKEDLGKFLIDCLDQDVHIHKRVGMATVAH